MTPGERTADEAWRNAKRIARLETRIAALEAALTVAREYVAAEAEQQQVVVGHQLPFKESPLLNDLAQIDAALGDTP